MKREVLIQGTEKEYKVLYTNRALLNTETWTGKSINQIVRGFVDGKSGVHEIARLLQAGMDAARRDAGEGKGVTLDDALDVLDDVGTINVLKQVQEAVAGVLNRDEGEEPDPNA